jgi:hypothetical protein
MDELAFVQRNLLKVLIEEKEKEKEKDNTRATPNSYMDNLIGYREPFYCCKEHPKVENIHREAIEQHILYYTSHKSL